MPGTIPGYLWDDYQEAVEMAFRKIERVEQAEIEEPQTVEPSGIPATK